MCCEQRAECEQLSLCAWLGVELIDTRCLNEEQVQWREIKYKRYEEHIADKASKEPPGPGACAEAARMGRNDKVSRRRSISPWTYREDRSEDRFPAIIPFAECLCRGCIVGGKENNSYNSKLVYTWLQVLKRKPCSTDVRKYVIVKDVIKVPLACTCVRPMVTNG